MVKFFEQAWIPLRALLVSALGVWGATLWFSDGKWLIAAGILGGVILGAHVLDAVGRAQLRRKPVRGVVLMEAWILSPLSWAVLASCAVVIVAVTFHVDEGTPTADAELIKALGAAITAFLTSGFVSWTEEHDQDLVAGRTKKEFELAYEEAYKPLKPPEEVERLFLSDAVRGIQGWSLAARYERASQFERYLREVGRKRQRELDRARSGGRGTATSPTGKEE